LQEEKNILEDKVLRSQNEQEIELQKNKRESMVWH
jgi:hypothetical protein